MLKSNWNLGSAKTFGRVHVIRQRIGYATPKKSNAAHKFMNPHSREALCYWLERKAAQKR